MVMIVAMYVEITLDVDTAVTREDYEGIIMKSSARKPERLSSITHLYL